MDLECECFLVATGRVSDVEKLNLEAAGSEYEEGKGVRFDDLASDGRKSQRIRGERLRGGCSVPDAHEWRNGQAGGSKFSFR